MQLPHTLGKYKILKELGRGGFATVYKAYDTKLNHFVALKILHPHWSADQNFSDRLRREARTVYQLKHPNIITIYAAGALEDKLHIAMAYLSGQTLQAILDEEKSLSMLRCLAILKQVAQALDYAHTQGITHRDVKPGNIMVDESGNQPHVTLLDFGLVKTVSESVSLTAWGTLLGSPEYMAPEQVDPNRADEIGPATDRYALGIVAYHILAGRVPFPGHTPATLYAHENKEVPPLYTFRPDLPKTVSAVLNKMLAKPPTERYPTAKAFVKALHNAWMSTRQSQDGEAKLLPLYNQLKTALSRRNWAKARLLVKEIEAINPYYRNIKALAQAAKYAIPYPRETIIWEIDAKEMVRIPASLLLYGNKWIDKTPVTNAEYARFVDDTNHPPPQHWRRGKPTIEIANHPVVYVSWYDAVAYAEWANKQLPTDQEWTWAAQGTDRRPYPWGTQPPTPKLCNFSRNESGTTPVGKYSPQGDSPYGCTDMAGNVWEWLIDSVKTPRLEGVEEKIMRGGGWVNDGGNVDTEAYYGAIPSMRSDIIGFRCVATKGGQTLIKQLENLP